MLRKHGRVSAQLRDQNCTHQARFGRYGSKDFSSIGYSSHSWLTTPVPTCDEERQLALYNELCLSPIRTSCVASVGHGTWAQSIYLRALQGIAMCKPVYEPLESSAVYISLPIFGSLSCFQGMKTVFRNLRRKWKETNPVCATHRHKALPSSDTISFHFC